ncbi:hypothetical protein D0Z03_000134 [Geotrichum reessii]|nr:hypothetical protein D0Z03_000134 [Galactomyces reessii]
MPEYSKQTVALLKQELDRRGLPKDGVKAELIKRLVADDASKSEAIEIVNEDSNEITTIKKSECIDIDDQENDTPVPIITTAIEPQVSAASVLAENPTVDSTSETVTSAATEAAASTNEETKETEKEKYNRIVLELKKRITRSQRFNNTTDKEAEMALKRIEKFGIQAAGKILKSDQQLHNKHGHGIKKGNRRFSNSSRPMAVTAISEDTEKLRKRKERFA